MIILHTIAEVRQYVHTHRMQGKTIGLVPTMGYLHEGHLSLVRQAKEQTDIAIMSIFVNPLQFGPNEDFDSYPRDLERDSQLAASAGIDAIFAPSVDTMYPAGNGKSLTHVDVEVVTDTLCGAARPGHFRGVSTVVSKLFNIVLPDKAFFGLKDAQQVVVIQQMVRDLDIPVEIVPCAIVREPDGLAMSSRNVFLNDDQRSQALVLSRSLQMAAERVQQGERDAVALAAAVRATIEEQPLADIDYVQIVSMRDLSPLHTLDQPALLALAVRFGKTRLIDNIVLHVHR
ncbi:pantoate--beta-alanine ligase [Tumebacillus permanentifrigoris]|uniref:Pantothenate synthetase n=1 Tax=Tumebacillus permanentifrigoris TaxID=378543 RepID=A0A316DEF7_9BACL|nr:pantoate--beta-alanine ligase [Tumebacillus permanentifrigoris]PWK15559.1 pantothenate synthetase [Tumebacillus permanentifrigoris]